MHAPLAEPGGIAAPAPASDPAAATQAALAALCHAFTSLSPEQVPALARRYADDARFKDPFQEVSGRAAIERVFTHMYTQLADPRFVVLEALAGDRQGFITWELHYRWPRGGGPGLIRGATHLRFDHDGRVVLHRDYWDAAEELYAKLPVLGPLMRWLRTRAAA